MRSLNTEPLVNFTPESKIAHSAQRQFSIIKWDSCLVLVQNVIKQKQARLDLPPRVNSSTFI